jgi:hypothetical protein
MKARLYAHVFPLFSLAVNAISNEFRMNSERYFTASQILINTQSTLIINQNISFQTLFIIVAALLTI